MSATDASILVAVMSGPEEDAMAADKERNGLTRSQIIYWSISGALFVGGCAATLFGEHIPVVGWVFKDLGPGIFTAGILALLAEPHFKKEFARDAFLAAFRYVLPTEFREEIEKIIRFEFVADRQLWTVKVDKVNDDTVVVTTSFDKTIKNRGKSTRKNRGYYTIHETSFPNGPSKIIDCRIETEDEIESEFDVTNPTGTELVAATKELDIKPGRTARVSGKGTQFRRTDDFVFETFGTPAINPEIEVLVPEDFDHRIEFGTPGDVRKSVYSNRYTLSGVYFPGQYMFVRWWPKKEKGHA
jgi:hypothetical protein